MTMATPPFPDRGLGDTRVGSAVGTADDAAMQVIALNPPASLGAKVRCECARCGAHVLVRRSWQISGWCQNCRSYDVRPLATATPPATPPALVDLVASVPVASLQARVA